MTDYIQEITQEEWEEKYHPNNLFTQDYIPEGIDIHLVWTQKESDNTRWIKNGYACTDAMGHYICDIPWEEGEEIIVNQPAPYSDVEYDESYLRPCVNCGSKNVEWMDGTKSIAYIWIDLECKDCGNIFTITLDTEDF